MENNRLDAENDEDDEHDNT